MTLQMAVGCGYGRPTPLNPTSQFLFNVACLTCKLAWAYFTKEVIDIFTIYFEKSNLTAAKIAQLNQLNQEEQLTSSYRQKLRSYFRRQQENSVVAYEI
jgi:arsenate reductase-like glutaredoxin family protein